MRLINNNIEFNEEEHIYTRLADGKILQGITGIIKEYFFKDMYSKVSGEVLRKAAHKGTTIHKEIEQIIEGFAPERISSAGDFVKEQIDAGTIRPIASEYTVTDGENFASNIDIVENGDGENTVNLTDIKTTYTLNKDYCSWQLSIYAYMFESCNPDLKVDKLRVLRLRSGKNEIIEVDKIDAEIVMGFLAAAATGKPFANPQEAGEREFEAKSLPTIQRIIELETQKKAIDEEQAELKAILLNGMAHNKIKKIGGSGGFISYREPSKTMRFDSVRFKKEQPDIYKEYTKESETAGSLIVKLSE